MIKTLVVPGPCVMLPSSYKKIEVCQRPNDDNHNVNSGYVGSYKNRLLWVSLMRSIRHICLYVRVCMCSQSALYSAITLQHMDGPSHALFQWYCSVHHTVREHTWGHARLPFPLINIMVWPLETQYQVKRLISNLLPPIQARWKEHDQKGIKRFFSKIVLGQDGWWMWPDHHKVYYMSHIALTSWGWRLVSSNRVTWHWLWCLKLRKTIHMDRTFKHWTTATLQFRHNLCIAWM